MKQLRRFLAGAWLWDGGADQWCCYGHHWTRQQIPWPKPSHYSHYFCNPCFHRWFDEV